MNGGAALPTRFGAALAIGYAFALANTFSRGAYSEHAIQFVVVGLLVAMGAFVLGLKKEPLGTTRAGVALGLAWAALLSMQWNAWNDASIVIYAQRDWSTGRTVEVASMLLLLTYLPAIAFGFEEPRWLSDGRFAAFGALVFAGGIATLRASPTPAIDVWAVQQAGADALLHGQNPYVATAVANTGPDVLPHGVPYVYPPLQIYLTAPAYALVKDVRYTMLTALIAFGVVVRVIVLRSPKALPSLAEDAPALFLWLSPKLFFIVEQAWIDPVQLALIAGATLVQLAGLRSFAAVLFGGVLASKQSMFWIAPLAAFSFRWKHRELLLVGATALVASLPFMIWDFHAWKYANYDFLLSLPARDDALSLTNWAQRTFHQPLVGRLAFPLGAGVVLLACLRNGPSPAKLGIAWVTTYTVFFTFNKWAFANYYFTLGGLACLAAALAFHDGPREPRESRDT